MFITQLLPNTVHIPELGKEYHLYLTSNEIDGQIKVEYRNKDESYIVCVLSNISPSNEDIQIIDRVLDKLNNDHAILVSNNFTTSVEELRQQRR